MLLSQCNYIIAWLSLITRLQLQVLGLTPTQPKTKEFKQRHGISFSINHAESSSNAAKRKGEITICFDRGIWREKGRSDNERFIYLEGREEKEIGGTHLSYPSIVGKITKKKQAQFSIPSLSFSPLTISSSLLPIQSVEANPLVQFNHNRKEKPPFFQCANLFLSLLNTCS